MKKTIIDSHVHPFVDADNNIAAYGAPNSLQEFMSELKKCGFSKVCGSVIAVKAQNFTEIQQLNRVALDIKSQYPDFFIPGVHVHAGAPEESCRELEYLYHNHQVRWVGELVHYLMNTGEYNCAGMFQIYETIRDLDMVVNIHCSNLQVIEDILRNFPTLKVVIAHPEDIGSAKKRFELVKQYANAYMDISGTGLFRWNMLRYAVDKCGSEKFLFGSDFPICSPAMNLGGLLGENLTEVEQDNILFKNFLRLTEN